MNWNDGSHGCCNIISVLVGETEKYMKNLVYLASAPKLELGNF
jgi:hypothetical protein